MIFCFVGRAYDVVFLFWRCVFHLNVIFLLEKVSNLSDIAFLSIAVKNIISLETLDNSKFFEESRIQSLVRLAKVLLAEVRLTSPWCFNQYD